jgi:hypothetical protein
MPGLLSFWKLTGSVFRDERRLSHVEQVVDAKFEHVLVRMMALGTVSVAVAAFTGRERKLLGAKPQVIVFGLDGPVVRKSVLDTETEQEAIQGRAGGGRENGGVYEL